jgi:hypothetical protein
MTLRVLQQQRCLAGDRASSFCRSEETRA